MYLPKNKIETNLFSSGELLLASTNQPYYGFYFKTFDGRFFTGKEPNDGPNNVLIQQQNVPGNDVLSSIPADLRYTPQNATYSVVTGQNSLISTPLPIFYTPQPTERDYQTGEFTRIFTKKHNENLYYEVEDRRISENVMYFTFSLQWVISGKEDLVSIINKNTVDLYMRNLPIPAFNKFLKDDYLKFWKPS